MRLLPGVLMAAALTLSASPAHAAAGPEQGCGVFPWVQTYRGWGPAEALGRTVTVIYKADECTSGFEDGIATLKASGDATILKGKTTSGSTLAVRSFSTEATWKDPSGGRWPIDWWSCDVEELSYDWQIRGLYSFSLQASDGEWRIKVSPDAVDWSYPGC